MTPSFNTLLCTHSRTTLCPPTLDPHRIQALQHGGSLTVNLIDAQGLTKGYAQLRLGLAPAASGDERPLSPLLAPRCASPFADPTCVQS
jgi:hypothetical protein